MGTVYEARHIELDNRVALKLIGPLDIDGPTSPALPGRVLREARAAARLVHDHVVRVFDVGVDGAFSFLVMELLDGDDLARVLKTRGSLTVEEAVDALLPVTSAVAAAHDAGILHRDLKPANVVLARGVSGLLRPVVTDFGICKILSDEEYDGLTQSAALVGSIPYLSPEQTRGAKYASPAADQYALGVMLYESVVGQRPFVGASGYEVMHAIVNATALHPSEVKPSVPRQFGDLILRAIHRSPGGRFPSVRDFGLALLPFAGRRTAAVWELAFTTDRVITCVDPHQEDGAANLTPQARFRERVWQPSKARWMGRRKATAVASVALSAVAGAVLSHVGTKAVMRGSTEFTTASRPSEPAREVESRTGAPPSAYPSTMPGWRAEAAERREEPPRGRSQSEPLPQGELPQGELPQGELPQSERPNVAAENSSRASAADARPQKEQRPPGAQRRKGLRRAVPLYRDGSGGTTEKSTLDEPELGSNHTVILE